MNFALNQSGRPPEAYDAQLEEAISLGVLGQIQSPQIRLAAYLSYYTLQPLRRILWLKHQDIGARYILFSGDPRGQAQSTRRVTATVNALEICDELAVILEQQPLADEAAVWLFPAGTRRRKASTQQWRQVKDALGTRHAFAVEAAVRPVMTYSAVAQGLNKAVESILPAVQLNRFSSKALKLVRARYLYFCQGMELSEIMKLTGHRSPRTAKAFLAGNQNLPLIEPHSPLFPEQHHGPSTV